MDELTGEMKNLNLPPTYYSLHADELKLLQFLLYHLKYKTQNKKKKKTRAAIEISKETKSFRFD